MIHLRSAAEAQLHMVRAPCRVALLTSPDMAKSRSRSSSAEETTSSREKELSTMNKAPATTTRGDVMRYNVDQVMPL